MCSIVDIYLIYYKLGIKFKRKKYFNLRIYLDKITLNY